MPTLIKISGDFVVLDGDPTSGNATVPTSAPIQPPQAFVDAMMQPDFGQVNQNGGLAWSGKGITGVDPGWFCDIIGNRVDNADFDLSSNSLSTASVDTLLLSIANRPGVVLSDWTSPTLNISGQTPPAPPTDGASNDNLLALQANGWTVTTD